MPRRKGSDIQAMQNAAKTLLANIRFAAIDKPIKTLTITSTRPNEGKTFVACALAEAACTSGRHVLLVECDMRHRSLGGALDIHGSRGLYSVLSGHHTLEDIIVPTRQPNLDFLDVEPGIPNPPDVIASKRFRRLVHDVRQDYDLVIFDTPPVGAFVDAAELSALTDGTLFVIRENFTKRDVAIDALEQLRKAGANVLGTVLNVCENTSTGYYEYYYREHEAPTDSVVEEPLDALPREGHVRVAEAKGTGSVPVITAAAPHEQASDAQGVSAPDASKRSHAASEAADASSSAPTAASVPSPAPVPAVTPAPAAASASAAKAPKPSETAAFVIAAQQSAQTRASHQRPAQPAAEQPAQRTSGYRGVGAAQQQRGAGTQATAGSAAQSSTASAVPTVPVMHGSSSSRATSAARQSGPYVPPKNNPYAR